MKKKQKLKIWNNFKLFCFEILIFIIVFLILDVARFFWNLSTVILIALASIIAQQSIDHMRQDGTLKLKRIK